MKQLLLVFCLLGAMHSSAVSAAETKQQAQNARSRLLDGNKNEKDPLLIRSETLSADSIKRVFVYKKAVEMTRGDLVVTADVVTGRYNEKNEIETIVCNGNVVITRGEELRASSELANYDVPKGVIELTQNPEVSQNGNILAADKVMVYVNDERSEALGNVHVKVADTKGTMTGVGGFTKSESAGGEQQPAADSPSSASSSATNEGQ